MLILKKNVVYFFLEIAMLVFGANKFYNFMPNPLLPTDAAVFIGALARSGYIFQILIIVFIIADFCLVLTKIWNQ